jgi:hypothetical protein
MKKLIIIVLGVLAIGVTSCQKDSETAPVQQENKLQANGEGDSIDKGNLGTWD